MRGRKERAGGGARASTANTPPSQTMSGILSRAPDPLFRLSLSYLLRPADVALAGVRGQAGGLDVGGVGQRAGQRQDGQVRALS